MNIDYQPSENRSSRNGAPIQMIVLHATVGSYDSALTWLRSPVSEVSTHYLIRKDGHLAQLVANDLCAWHAGVAAWHGHADVNERSIGIELENANDERDPWPAAQLDSARSLCQSLIARYGITRAGIVRHLDVALPPGRKTDPAGFPFAQFADSCYGAPTPDPRDVPAIPIRERHFVVKKEATGGATIRGAARTSAAVLGRLHAGDAWAGDVVIGQQITVALFGGGNQWVSNPMRGFVWLGLLDEIAERKEPT